MIHATEEQVLLVEEELKKYKFQYIVEFVNMFPIDDIKICFTAYQFYDGKMRVTTMCRKKQASTYLRENSDDLEIRIIGTYPDRYADVSCSSITDFWERWNRFKRLKIFL